MAKKEKIRLLNTQNVQVKKFSKFEGFTGRFGEILGEPDRGGIWLVYGSEKNGKTWVSLMLAMELSNMAKVLYISAEEGISSSFQDTLARVGVSHKNRNLLYYDYMEIDEIEEVLSRQKGAPKVVFFDNLTVYADALRYGVVRRLQLQYPKVLFVYIGHEEKGDVYTATGKLVKRLAKVIIYVEGLRAIVGGRCPGGEFDVDTEKVDIYYGQKL